MNLISVSLAKALKMKNRLAGRLAKVTNDIRCYNSVLVETKDAVNVLNLVELRSDLVQALVQLKTAIFVANVAIQEKIFVMAEKKSQIEMYSGMPTRNGKERHDYQNTEIEYYAHFKKDDIDKAVKVLESDIDRLQDSIDEYNVMTKITLPQKILDLAS